ncbi:thioredoxin family protein [Pontibacter sp. JAM-7]|uniref:thioredoxin family protein n=1 Tax=Pontibacter sp. JAM-7 TaxID=3366581 RepID=UPI003AF7135A
MKTVKVIGSGCTKCNKTADLLRNIADELGVKIHLVKDTDPQSLLTYGVMSTPAVVIDDTLVHSGQIPTREQVSQWLR